jgi:hypothetical protein
LVAVGAQDLEHLVVMAALAEVLLTPQLRLELELLVKGLLVGVLIPLALRMEAVAVAVQG